MSAANTARDGTGTIVTLYTAGSNGAVLEYLWAKATVTTTAGMIRFFLSTDAGSTKRLLAEIQVQAITVGASTLAWEGSWVPVRRLTLPASAIIYASTHNAEAVNVFAVAGDL